MYQKIAADHIFNGYQTLPGQPVLVLDQDGLVIDIVQQEEAGEEVFQTAGILSPGFVNCHCHLELSHLHHQIESGQGLISFIGSVMERRQTDELERLEAMKKADEEMWQNGIVAVGDICNTSASADVKKSSPVYYHSFVEIAGFPEHIAESRFEYARQIANVFSDLGLSHSIVPHAPYSVSDQLMKMIYGLNEQSVFSIHNQETAEENDWFKNKQGGFEFFYQQLNVDTQHFSSKNKSSLAHLLQYMNPHQRHMLVHNVHTSTADLNAAMEHFQSHPEHLFFCYCPQANQYISQQLPNIKMFQQQGANIILGTDSLASNHQLDLMSEMQLLQHQYPELTMDDMLRWATIQGARALGIDGRYGSFEKGKSPGVVTIHNGKAKPLVMPR